MGKAIKKQKRKPKITADELEMYKTRLLQEMLGHVGKSRTISMARLHDRVFKKVWADKINDTRTLRRLITALRDEGVPICSAANGYFVSSAGSELAEYCSRIRSRALGMLKREARLRKMTLPELVGEVALDLDAAA